MEGHSKLEQARLDRGWSRAHVERITNGRIPEPTLTNWEKKRSFPRDDSIKELCRLYNATPEQLGLVKAGTRGIMGTTTVFYAPQEGTPMSDIVRRAVFSNLGSKLTGLIDLWPKRNYHYEELQSAIDKAVIDYNAVVAQESSYELNRRDALKSVALVPVQLIGGLAIIETGKAQKTDTDILLKHCAAGIPACWYLRRGKELNFVSGLISEYTKILQSLIHSHSETYRKASAALLVQCFMLQGSLIRDSKNNDPVPYYHEAARYALITESATGQAIANREIAYALWHKEDYSQALSYAEQACDFAKNTNRIIQSYTFAALTYCQATTGNTNEALTSLDKARNLFDESNLPITISYSSSILASCAAITQRHLGNYKEAANLYTQSIEAPDASALGKLQALIDRATVEAYRDDQPRDMRLALSHWEQGILGAKELGSERFMKEARECHNLLRVAWPREDAIKRLGRDHF